MNPIEQIREALEYYADYDNNTDGNGAYIEKLCGQPKNIVGYDGGDKATIALALLPQLEPKTTEEEALKISITAYCKDQFDNQHDNIGCTTESMQAAIKALKAAGLQFKEKGNG